MKRSTLLIIALAVSLVGTNALWIYLWINNAITLQYAKLSFNQSNAALAQALIVMPIAARVDSTPAQVLDAAKRVAKDSEQFEKDGFIWVGSLGLRFDEKGRVSEVVSNGLFDESGEEREDAE